MSHTPQQRLGDILAREPIDARGFGPTGGRGNSERLDASATVLVRGQRWSATARGRRHEAGDEQRVNTKQNRFRGSFETSRRPRVLSDRTHVKRLDIQGLRTVAVGLVIANHLTGQPRGGFIGVDVFFVISGFLITGNLMRSESRIRGPRSAVIAIGDFYRKRIKRILPAALLVLVSIVVAAHFLFTATRAADARTAATWAALFGANIHFAKLGTDYFGETAAVSPVQHFWSLSVEEQFYFVWPLLLFIVFGLVARTGRLGAARVVAGGAMGLIIVASFGYALLLTSSNATLAYFSSPARAWELGLGALLAITTPVWAKLNYVTGTVMAWAGLVVIAVGAFVVGGDSGFPAPAAAIPVLGSALVLAAGIRGPQEDVPVLTNQVMVYLGDASYSLYLWHFPIIVFLQPVLANAPTATYYASALILTLLVSITAFELVENPLRIISWRDPLGSLLRFSPDARRRLQMGALAAGASLCVGLFAPTLKPVVGAAESEAESAALSQLVQATETATEEATPETAKQVEILQALSATSWPTLSPPIGEAASDKAPEFAAKYDCMYPDPTDRTACTFGKGPKLAVVIGDSIGVSWMPGIRTALGHRWRVRDIGYGSCAFLATDRKLSDPTAERRCNSDREAVVNLVNSLAPDLIILTNNQGAINSLASGATGQEAVTAWTEARSDAIRSVSASGRDIVILTPPPVGKAADDCAGAGSAPADCVSGIGRTWKDMVAGDIAAATATGARLVDTSSWFCAADSGRCPIFVGTSPVRTDELHLTATYAEALAPLLRLSLLPSAEPSSASGSPTPESETSSAPAGS
ncbi:MAG: acyltransferase family protein [Nocardioides sp.]|uniref:acyltransferase family protein n=1 Tax=Nocardioides sp. TaxID=35761 RepID=UPI0039E68D75